MRTLTRPIQSIVVVVLTVASMMCFGPVEAASQSSSVLPTGATITPNAAPGSVSQALTVDLPDYPNRAVDGAQTTSISPDGKTLLILTSGFNKLRDANGAVQPQDSSEYVFVYDISNSSAPVKKQVVFVPRAFGGLVWSPDGTRFYVAGGPDDNLHTYAQTSGQWAEVGTPVPLNHKGGLMNLETQTGPTASGVGITADGRTVVVANWETDSVTTVDVLNGVVLSEFDLRPGLINPAQTGVAGGEFPFGVVVKGSNTVYVSSARDREIEVLNMVGGVLTLTKRILVKGNPGKMVLNRSQSRLYVAVGNADALVTISTNSNQVISRVNTSAPAGLLTGQGNFPKGSNPNSVALSPDEKTAYVTNAGTNNVAIIRLGEEPFVAGLIPTDWQPNSSSASPDGKTLYVVNGKSNTGPNRLNCRFINAGGNYGSACMSLSAQNGSGNNYAWQNMHGSLLVTPVPSGNDLQQLTRLVAQNNGFNLRLSRRDVATMRFLRDHIKHVIYIIKENRTYDQILGDLPVGNGDPTLTQFPDSVTPNQHAIASNFVDFDNFYDTGNGSMDGWQWSTAGRALDFEEKSQVINYGKGGSAYDSEGTDRNVNVGISGVAQRQAWQPLYPNDPNLLPGNANEVAADGPEDGEEGLGYIWDAAIRSHLSVRNYGFFLDLGRGFQIDVNITDPCGATPPVQVAFPAHPSLVPRTDYCFRGYDNAFPDFFRFKEWSREFQQQVQTHSFPSLSLIRFSHDHFGSFGSAIYGVNTPELQAADNDYAVGLLVDQIAHSPYADSTLVFVVEDDPQDGADHVSANRSVVFVAGPYLKHGAVVFTHYATPSILRTIEEVLGLENLGVHDAGLPPMADAFDTTQKNWTFHATPAPVLFNTTLPLDPPPTLNLASIPKPTHDAAWWEERTKSFDFSKEDRVDPEVFNRVIWRGLKGDRPYPTNRSGLDLRKNREQLLKSQAAAQTAGATGSGGSQ